MSLNRLEPSADLNDPRTRFALNESLDLMAREIARLKGLADQGQARSVAAPKTGQAVVFFKPEMTWTSGFKVSGSYTRHANYMRMRVSIQPTDAILPAATELYLYLPDRLHVDHRHVGIGEGPVGLVNYPGLAGHVYGFDSSGPFDWSPGSVLVETDADSRDVLYPYLPIQATPYRQDKLTDTAPFTWADGDVLEIVADVPIAEWRE